MRFRDAVLLIFIAFIWGFNFVVIRWGLNHFPPLLFSALRFSACILPIAFGMPRPVISWGSLMALGITLGLCVFGFLYLGINAGMGAGLASVLMQAQVFFTLIISLLLFGERPDENGVMAISLGIAGLTIIYLQGGQQGSWSGFWFVMLAALSWGVSNTIIKKLPRVNMLELMVWISIVPPIPLFILSFLFEDHALAKASFIEMDWRGWLAVLYTAFLSTILAYSVWGTMLQRYSADKAAPFALLVPVFGITSAWVFLGTEMRPADLIGPAFIIVALSLNFRANIGTTFRGRHTKQCSSIQPSVVLTPTAMGKTGLHSTNREEP